jgi:nucleoside-diphosphate kinase
MNRTLVICKPDAVERGLVGEILVRFERKGLRFVAGEFRMIDPDLAEIHYAEHRDEPYFDHLVKFICRSQVFVMVVEGPEDTWQIVRELVGPTDPAEAAPGTIRGDFSAQVTENIAHASDSPISAAREIALFFPNLSTRPVL